MKRLEIFKAGKQTASSGQTLSFGEQEMRATVEAYDPAKHEAPVVVGHPKDNAPAYGWIKGLEFGEDGTLRATTDQIDPEFAEMVKAGRFKKRSASFYRPDSPSNPVPGTFYLRHVGFLGAQPPAVKGLADPEFNDSPEDVIEFADDFALATLFRRMREFFIERFGAEDADKVLPSFLIEDMEDQARHPIPADDFTEGDDDATPPDGTPGCNDDDPTPPEDNTMTQEEIDALKAKAERADQAEAELQTLKDKAADFAEREAKLKRAEIERQVDALIEEGRVMPANRQATVDYAASLDDSEEIEFSEGEGKDPAKRTQLGRYLDLLAKQPKAVDFGEHSGEGEPGDTLDYAELSDRANAWKDKQKGLGKHISTAQAIRDVQAGRDK
ncbi:MAG: hypothetical protein ACOC0M_00390 [Halomonas sp.]